MNFIVEDGTGLATSTSYTSIAYADAYFSQNGNMAWPFSLSSLICTFDETGKTITDDDLTDFEAIGIYPGLFINLNFATNSGWYTVADVATNVITVSEALIDATSETGDLHYTENKTLWLKGSVTLQKERVLNNATRWLDGRYSDKYPGYKDSGTQALQWPREYAFDRDGYELEEVPTLIKQATCESAYLNSTGTALDETIENGITGYTKRVGPITDSKTFSGSSSSRKIYTVIDDMLKTIISGRGIMTVKV